MDNLDGEEEKEEPGIGYAEYLSASEETYPYPYCDMVSSMPTACLENSILELWAEDGEYSDEAFEALTREDVSHMRDTVEPAHVLESDMWENFCHTQMGM